MIDMHRFFQPKDEPPVPEDWVLRGWKRGYAIDQLMAEGQIKPLSLAMTEEDKNARDQVIDERDRQLNMKVGEPHWDELLQCWVITSELE